ncbi:MAG TPA: aldo/keto reductase [Rhizomicrobium sp.]|jgi:aryl-alcohol dehydrogenase-like predicted oxidoreductase
MKQNALGPLGQVSRLTLGGGGIGHIWGPSSREESIATIHAALDGGIDLLDTAPMYGNCEAIIGETFNGNLPAHVRITTKCFLGSPNATDVEQKLTRSLDASLAAMKLKRVDVLFLHSNICADDYVYAVRPDLRDSVATTWPLYTERFIPAAEKLKAQGKIGMWAITGTGVPATILGALDHAPKPAIVQAMTNLMDSAGALRRYAEPAQPRAIIAKAKANGIGVMGIRAVQAGALTAQIDRSLSVNHPETKDYDRAAPYRELCKRLGQDPAVLAHRYAMSMDGVDTVVLGVKNRTELAQCLEGERQGTLTPDEMKAIDDLGLRA